MAEYIEREALLNDLENSIVVSCKTENIPQVQRVLSKIINCIKDQPTADVAEVRHGEWKLFSSDKIGNVFICSICGYIEVTEDFETTPLDNDCNYCSKCGAKMDKE